MAITDSYVETVPSIDDWPVHDWPTYDVPDSPNEIGEPGFTPDEEVEPYEDDVPSPRRGC